MLDSARLINERGVCFFSVHQLLTSLSGLCWLFSRNLPLHPGNGKKGKSNLYTNSMVRKVTADEKWESYLEYPLWTKRTLKEYQAKSRVVYLSLSMWSSKNLMEYSKSKAFQDGHRRASSGTLGRYFTRLDSADRWDKCPILIKLRRYNEDGVGGLHMYTPLVARQ